MKSSVSLAIVIPFGLAVAGLGLRPVEEPLWTAMRASEPAMRLRPGVTSVEHALVPAALGGLRAAAADIVWLTASGRVEKRELADTDELLRLVTTLDARPLYFWLNGARIMAYDMPAWRILAAGGYGTTPAVIQRGIERAQARRALRYLDEAMVFHPTSASLWIERPNIELNRLDDLAGAAESYLRAWEQPNAPYYAARLHGELLRRLGQKPAALAWLRRLHPQLPPGDESAGADLVLARIRRLERELGVPADQAYVSVEDNE